MSATPDISFVAASRNDNHGGNLRHRMQVFVEALLGQCDRHCLDAELVLVEWNPPPDRPGLSEALRWPRSERCPVRVIEVPAELHRRFGNADSLPLHQMIAKNAGIRRARGRFVAATNIDVLFSDGLMEFLAAGLDPHKWYRANRYDVDRDVPENVPAESQLAYCEDNLLRIHRRDGTRDLRTRAFDRIYRDPAVLKAFLLLAPLAFLPGLGGRLRNAERSLKFIEECGRLHTNACGDFTCMARKRWHDLHGYWEFAGFPAHVDGLICHAARFLGLDERVLADPARVYHIEHGSGSGYLGYASGEKWKRLDAAGVPRLTRDDYTGLLFDIKSGRKPAALNVGDWGLEGENLPETTPLP